MKNVSVIATAALLSLGSLVAFAQDDTQTQGSGGDSAFSVIDQNGDGSIDKDEAENSGISDSRFDSMDKNGDGEVSQSEYEGKSNSGGSGWQ